MPERPVRNSQALLRGHDLYRVDLSQVISKYIGETERNLRRVFESAERLGSVLLFDEADALFGKRGVVKDRHDRFGNLETAYLLSRIKSATVPVLLAFNLNARNSRKRRPKRPTRVPSGTNGRGQRSEHKAP